TIDNEAAILAYLQNNNLSGFTKTASAMHYNITTKNPTGKTVELGEEVRAYFKLTLLNGSIIDTALVGDPLDFGFYAGYIFPGFLEATALLKEGEKGTFLIPASLAFLGQSSGNIPAWSVLKADIEILSFRDENEQIEAYISKKGITNAEVTSTGLRFIPTAVVSGGTELVNGNQVVLKYKGTLLNDVTFDSGEITVTLGASSVIPGFEEGIKKMKVGEKATIIFPSTIGYGVNGSGSILPYSPLLFELEILSKR
ncbi:MAG: FKBP-type peptidyl-prolyl cis-trans isomerase, partial [Spirosomaceae bacterium]|nr:FKBP-type peptidyl-prolyl cis-trans isomerase [Spirosomataceae bacterium]